MSAPDPVISDEDRAVLVAQIQALGALQGPDATDPLTCTVGELRDQLEAYRGAVEPKEITPWDRAMQILDYIGQVSGKLTPVVGLVGAAVGLGKAAAS